MKAVVLCTLLALPLSQLGAEGVKTKGYYEEDGTYIKQRTVDPIHKETTTLPTLTNDLTIRKDQISRVYKGQVVTSKISFPACHSGITLASDDLGRTNVEIFDKVNRYGATIEKGDKALITGFDIGKNDITIELNNGGYGSAGDVTKRVVADIFTLGLAELWMDHDRTRHGSRLTIALSQQRPFDFRPGDLNTEAFKEAILTESPSNNLIRKQLGVEKDQVVIVNEEQLRSALDKVLVSPTFYKDVQADKLSLPKETRKLLAKARTAKHPLGDTPQRWLNREILCALYPQAIQKRSSAFNVDTLDFKSIESYLTLVFERDVQAADTREAKVIPSQTPN